MVLCCGVWAVAFMVPPPRSQSILKFHLCLGCALCCLLLEIRHTMKQNAGGRSATMSCRCR